MIIDLPKLKNLGLFVEERAPEVFEVSVFHPDGRDSMFSEPLSTVAREAREVFGLTDRESDTLLENLQDTLDAEVIQKYLQRR